MPPMTRFATADGRPVPAVTAAEMRAVDRAAVEEVGLPLPSMMENAGRALAGEVRPVAGGPVVVLAGDGGNGGGGLAAARRLANAGVAVRVVLDRPPAELTGAAATQHGVVDAIDVPVAAGVDALAGAAPGGSTAVVDALVGYGLAGPLRAPVDAFADWANERAGPVVSLDVPSGVDATTGDRPGTAVRPDRTVTLALPKPGLADTGGDLRLADLGIPGAVYGRAGVEYEAPFDGADVVALERRTDG
jgi:NAD(P)H-hydrate epimerase